MASLGCLPSCKIITGLPCKKSRVFKPLQVRAQSHRDEGRSKNIVDDNLCILKERIEEVRTKERLERCCLIEAAGWNYTAPADPSFGSKKDQELLQFGQLVGTLTATFGLTVFSCTLFLWIVSIWVHFNP